MAEVPPDYNEVVPQQQHPTQEQPYYAQQQQPQPTYAEQPYYAQQPPQPMQQQPTAPQQTYYAQQPPPQQPIIIMQQQPQPIPPEPQQPEPYYEDNNTAAINATEASNTTETYYGASDYGDRLDYVAPQYRDKIWAIIWLAHLAIMFIVLFASFGSVSVGRTSSSSGYLIIFVCGAMGAVMGYLWTVILRRFSGIIIKFMMWANLVMLIISTIVTFAAGLIINGVILLIITVFFAFYMWRVWHRIPFAQALIAIASDIIKQYTGIIWVALLMMAAQIVWILIWGGSVAILLGSQNITQSYVIYFVLMISLYWNLETFKNLCHCTVCGVAAAWYFSPYPQSPTKAALKRSCTTSLGSVALGSLIVSIIQATRAIVRQAARDGRLNACLACLIDCFLGCLERWIEFFNKYAYAHVSIYGESFIQAAKQTWSLLKAKGIDAWINDDLVGFALICGALIGGFVCAAVGGLMAMINDNIDGNLATAFALLGFFVGFYLCWTVLNTVASCVVAIFVCYAEDPNAMEINRPDDYYKLTAARTGISPNDFEEQQMQQQPDNQQPDNQQQQQQPQQQQQQQQAPPQQQQYGNMYNKY